MESRSSFDVVVFFVGLAFLEVLDIPPDLLPLAIVVMWTAALHA